MLTTAQFPFLPRTISLSSDEVYLDLNSLGRTRGFGPDGVSASFLYRCCNMLNLSICIIFKKSLAEGVFPSVWKVSKVTPILKSGNPTNVMNYRPISGLPFLGK